MITEQLQKKIDQAIKLLRSTAPADGSPVEIAYSGGKDSDVILQLAKEAGINYRAIYKNTTIDPVGTIKHAEEMGAEVVRPKKTFFQLVEERGYPSRTRRFCCEVLKEYKILDKAVVGVRKSESRKRNERYNEPTACRVYGKDKHVEQIYPILTWTDADVRDFLQGRGVKCAPVYYDEQGTFHVERRLGCMACPQSYYKQRVEIFKNHPNFTRRYILAGRKYMQTHPDSKVCELYADEYEYFYRNLFCDKQYEWEDKVNGLFGKPDFKEFLERYFNIKL